MKSNITRFHGILVSLAVMAGPALADPSCWQAPELKAYDLTMQTLMMAHVAAACDGVVKADPPLKAQFGAFLGKYGQQMQTDRAALAGYYQRAYGTDWQGPMQKSLDREDGRVTVQVNKAVSPDTCSGAVQLIGALGSANWQDFVTDAESQHWHERAGFPACQ
jgi:hypothetical protein